MGDVAVFRNGFALREPQRPSVFSTNVMAAPIMISTPLPNAPPNRSRHCGEKWGDATASLRYLTSSPQYLSLLAFIGWIEIAFLVGFAIVPIAIAAFAVQPIAVHIAISPITIAIAIIAIAAA